MKSSRHVEFKVKTNVHVYFADSLSPRHRGQDESTDRRIRQFFPKGPDLSRWRARLALRG